MSYSLHTIKSFEQQIDRICLHIDTHLDVHYIDLDIRGKPKSII